MNKKVLMYAAAFAVAAAAVFVGFFMPTGRAVVAEDDARGQEIRNDTKQRKINRTAGLRRKKSGNAVLRKGKDQKSVRRGVAARSAKPHTLTPESEEKMTPEEKKLANTLQAAVDSENLKEVRRLAVTAASSKNRDIRLAMVQALSWFGKEALPEMAPFIADKDEDVAQEAASAVEQALSEIENEKERIDQTAMFMKASNDAGSLEMLAMTLNAADNNAYAIEAVISIVESGNALAAEKAKEAYEFISGEPYTTAEAAHAAAQKWNEENPPEPEEGAAVVVPGTVAP